MYKCKLKRVYVPQISTSKYYTNQGEPTWKDNAAHIVSHELETVVYFFYVNGHMETNFGVTTYDVFIICMNIFQLIPPSKTIN